MIKVAILLAIAAAVVCAIEEPVPIVSQDADSNPDGSYRWSFESADGTAQQQSATVEQVDKDHIVPHVQGSVTYVDNDGIKHELSYEADKDGFKPVGSDIPTVAPLSEAIQKVVDYQLTHLQEEAPIKTLVL